MDGVAQTCLHVQHTSTQARESATVCWGPALPPLCSCDHNELVACQPPARRTCGQVAYAHASVQQAASRRLQTMPAQLPLDSQHQNTPMGAPPGGWRPLWAQGRLFCTWSSWNLAKSRTLVLDTESAGACVVHPMSHRPRRGGAVYEKERKARREAAGRKAAAVHPKGSWAKQSAITGLRASKRTCPALLTTVVSDSKERRGPIGRRESVS